MIKLNGKITLMIEYPSIMFVKYNNILFSYILIVIKNKSSKSLWLTYDITSNLQIRVNFGEVKLPHWKKKLYFVARKTFVIIAI